MSAPDPQDWTVASRAALDAGLRRIAVRLAAGSDTPAVERATATESATESTAGSAAGLSIEDAREPTPSEGGSAHALARLVARFGLSPFERDVLLLCAGHELSPEIQAAIARHHGEPSAGRPTFSLALAALEGGHWSAVRASGTLRLARLVALEGDAGPLRATLRIQEPVLHHLLGLPEMDERLRALVTPIDAPPALTRRQRAQAEAVVEAWSVDSAGGRGLVQLVDHDPRLAMQIIAQACALVGLVPLLLHPDALPGEAEAQEELASLLDRDAVLCDAAILVDEHAVSGEMRQRARRFVERSHAFAAIATDAPHAPLQRRRLRLELARPNGAEQRGLWVQALGETGAALNGHLDMLSQHFLLGPTEVRDVVAEVASRTQASVQGGLEDALWHAARERARGGLDALAQRLSSQVGWDDLVLPEAQRTVLRSIATHLRQRTKVYETWGFADKGSRGLGITALFAGPSGTGKTMAAEVLANELRLDLYRIDLSATVSKYIGETEKNLRRLFDAAEGSGAILLFDEADALFGKRSEVRDSHDRYANLEISYLLQRMEAYRGLAILTTNLKDALDQAFARRLRFVLHVPFPSTRDRAQIWRRALPAAAPCDELDFDKLSRLSVAGGNIRNIVLDAAFRAAEEDAAIGMRHLLTAARIETAKSGRQASGAEVGAWT